MIEKIENVENLKYAENLGIKLLDKQFESIDVLNNSAGVLVGMISVFFGIVLATGIPNDMNETTILFIISLLGFATSLAVALYAASSSQYRYIATPEKLWELTIENELNFRKKVFSNINSSFEKNKEILDEKWNYLRWAYILIMISICILIIYIALNIGR